MRIIKNVKEQGINPKNFKFIILENPEPILKDKIVQNLLADIIVARQEGYKKASDNYVTLDKLDLIGTHILLCDLSVPYQPKVISGLRLSFNNTCKKYGLHLPMEDNIKYASKQTQVAYEKFKRGASTIVESNSWFIDSEFSFKKTNFDLATIFLNFMVLYLIRKEVTHFMTATNEKFKASRWVDFGSFIDGYNFIHPAMPDKHKIILMEDYNWDKIYARTEQHIDLYENAFEIFPDETSIKDLYSTVEEIKKRSIKENKKAA